MRNRKPDGNERGSAVIEASLSLLLFYTLIFGMVTLGFAVYVEQTLTHGLRDAARYGVVHAYETDSQLMGEVRNLALCGTTTSCGGAFGLTPADVTVSCPASLAPPDETCRNADRMVVSLRAHGLMSFTPGLAGLSGGPITASLPIENTSGAVE